MKVELKRISKTKQIDLIFLRGTDYEIVEC